MTETFWQRTETYLGNSGLYTEPKETSRFLTSLIAKTGRHHASLVDVGCGVGEFLHHAKQCFPGFRLTGIDTSDVLLEQARSVPGLKDVEFRQDEATTFSYTDYQAAPFDFVTCSGVLSIFDDPLPLLGNLIANVRRGGHIYVVSMFNDDDIDVRVRYRDNRHAADVWQLGHNIHATATLRRWLTGRVHSFQFMPFEMPFDLPRRSNYPHRGWTITTSAGVRLVISGLCLIYYEKILEIVP